jgi:peroxiredoxin
MKTHLRFFLSCAAVTAGIALTSAGGQAFAQAPGSDAPAWELKDLDGKAVKLADFKGKVVVLDFWATWCPPCRAEIPGFIELQKQYGEKGLAIVGVSLDQAGAATVKAFVEKNKMNYPVVMGDDTTVKAYGGINGIPTTFVIDRKGKIAGKHIGFADKAKFEKEIKPLL